MKIGFNFTRSVPAEVLAIQTVEDLEDYLRYRDPDHRKLDRLLRDIRMSGKPIPSGWYQRQTGGGQ